MKTLNSKLLCLLALLLCVVLIGCGEVTIATKQSQKEKEEESTSLAGKESGSAAESQMDSTSGWKDPTEPDESSLKIPDESPYILRQDYYQLLYQNPEKQEFGILNKNGLKVQRKTAELPAWDSILLEGSSRDGSSALLYFFSHYYNDFETKHSLFSLRDGSYSLLSEIPWYGKDRSLFSPDGSAVLGVALSGQQFSTHLYRDGKDVVLMDLGQSTYFEGGFSPDGQSVLYMTHDPGQFGGKDYQSAVTHIRLPDGEEWELEKGYTGITLSDNGRYVYLAKGAGLYVQKKNDSGSRVCLREDEGQYFPRIEVGGAYWFDGISAQYRFWYSQETGCILNEKGDQILYFEETETEDEKELIRLCCSENGEPGKTLLEVPCAGPLAPGSIARYERFYAHDDNVLFILRGMNPPGYGFSRLNGMVYMAMEGRGAHVCDLYWVDENWDAQLLAEGVEAATAHISEDGRILHFLKEGNLYCMDLAVGNPEAKRLAEGIRSNQDYAWGSDFWVSYDGKNVLWFDEYGNAYTVTKEGEEAYILTDGQIDFEMIRPAGDSGFVYVLDGKLYYTESGNGTAISGLTGTFGTLSQSRRMFGTNCMVDMDGVYVYLISEDAEYFYHYITADGQTVDMVFTEKKSN